MAGGHATHAGIQFQNEVAAWMAVHILSSKPLTAINASEEALPTALFLETTSPVDDIVVHMSTGGRYFINVKTSVSSSNSPESELSKVFDQFVRQWLAGVNLDSGEHRNIDAKIDKFVLALSNSRGHELASAFKVVLQRIRDRAAFTPNDEIATTQVQSELLENCIALIRHHWNSQVGREIDNQDVLNILSLIYVIRLDADGAGDSLLETLLEHSTTGNSSEAKRAIESIKHLAGIYSKMRTGVDATALREQLRQRGISLIGPAEFGQDIAHLKILTARTLNALAHYGSLHIKNEDGSFQNIVIERECSPALQEAASRHSVLVVGDPGSGKSGVLYSAAKGFLKQGRTVLMLAVDQLSSGSLDDLQRELELQHPVVDVLSAWQPVENPILLIDALDASRGGASERAITQLITAIHHRASHWRVIASIRKFDLRYGAKYQGLFEGAPIATSFADPEFDHLAHLNVPQLSDLEIKQIRSQWQRLSDLLATENDAFKKLVRSPFNLFLLSTILARANAKEDIATTQLDLLGRYWLHRVEGPSPTDAFKNSRVVALVIDEIVSNRRMFVATEKIPSDLLDSLSSLLQQGVLVQPPASQSLIFGHHMLFDFALAKLRLLSNVPTSVKDYFLASDDDTLLIAPAATLALRIIWNTNRGRFWDLAFLLASDENIGTFSRSLPAIVAANSIASVQDIQPILEKLAKFDPAQRSSSIFLVRHIFGVLLAQVIDHVPAFGSSDDPWCAIVRALCEVAMKDLLWPMKAVVGTWTGDTKQLSGSQLHDLGISSRLMLDASIGNDGPIDDGAISAAISGIARSFETDKAESEQALRPLLSAKRLARHEHTELSTFARHFKRIAESSPGLAADFMRAIYSADLPSQEEKTYLGNSRILPLTSNKKQDFEGIRYQIKQNLTWFLVASPNSAMSAIGDCLRHVIKEEARSYSSQEPSEIRFEDVVFHVYADYSSIWWNENSHYHDVRSQLLDSLVEAYVQILESEKSTHISTYVKATFSGKTYASVVSALLKALTKAPLTRTDIAVSLLTNVDILSRMDTSYLSGELLKIVHPAGNQEQRIQLENAIECVSDDHIKNSLLSCLDRESIQVNSVRQVKAELERNNAVRPNTPPFKVESGWIQESDDNWWLKSQGIDVDDQNNLAVIAATNSLKINNLPTNREESLAKLEVEWKKISDVLALVSPDKDVPLLLLNQVMDAIAELCQSAAEKSESEEDLSRFPHLQKYIELCLNPLLTPQPVPDEEQEKAFEHSASWGRPAPRVGAAAALMLLIRAQNSVTQEQIALALSLARDPSVAIRHTILSKSNVVCLAAPDLSLSLSKIAFSEEKNIGVLNFFLHSLHNYLFIDSTSFIEPILQLDSRIQEERDNEDLADQISSLLFSLWLHGNEIGAKDRIEQWISAPLRFTKRINHILISLRELITFGASTPYNPKNDDIRKKGRILFEAIVEKLAADHTQIYRSEIFSDETRLSLTTLTRLLDTAAHQLYFGSGAYEILSKSKHSQGMSRPTSGDGFRFLTEYEHSLKLLAAIPYPSVTHPVLETLEAFLSEAPELALRLLLLAVVEGGKRGGYTGESMGADLVVKLVRIFIADYPALISGKQEYRKGIVEALNLFAEYGWPEARKLVYSLPEMLR